MDILTTPRLRLRETLESDIVPLHENVLGVAEVMRHAFGGAAMTYDAAKNFIRAHFNLSAAMVGMATLVETQTDSIVGFAGLNPCRVLGEDDLEIGFVLARNAWGKGYAQEIGAAQLAFGFNRLGCSRLLAQTAPDNVASIRVLQKLQMQFVERTEHPERGPRNVYLRAAQS